MTVLHTILTVIQVLSAVALTAIVLLQSNKGSGLGSVIGGSGESFLSTGKATTLDAKLAKATKWIGGIFLLLTLVLNLF